MGSLDRCLEYNGRNMPERKKEKEGHRHSLYAGAYFSMLTLAFEQVVGNVRDFVPCWVPGEVLVEEPRNCTVMRVVHPSVRGIYG